MPRIAPVDHSGDIIAFLHGAHASDHHMPPSRKPMTCRPTPNRPMTAVDHLLHASHVVEARHAQLGGASPDRRISRRRAVMSLACAPCRKAMMSPE